ncbi:hypothetical protein FDP41_008092 [Naegleria fowleri]|uniref:CSC1/OSCA1-like 7TM region domain-containing protein n=1 Tax=Naegleria fowleri TaxID=5763 RepID=A0A6A5BH79_NAEFO|nr:uncharacterized protein FDP41_008092 [Naegleria fowleri]KAF0973388.1 hypothetical protein FDP41_008092 [Naegleria fowleri]
MNFSLLDRFTVMAEPIFDLKQTPTPTSNNTQVNINEDIAGSAGVLTTLVANIVVALIYFVMFFLCCRQLAVFNPEKKKRLFIEYLKDMEEEAESKKTHAEPSTKTSRNEETTVEIEGEKPHALSFIGHRAGYYTEKLSHAYQEIAAQYPFNQLPRVPSETSEFKERVIPKLKQMLIDAFNSSALFFPAIFRHLKDAVLSFFVPSYAQTDRIRNTKRYGKDIAVYLYFQQIIIWILLICTVLTCAVLLPIHLTGQPPVYEYNMTYIDQQTSSLQIDYISNPDSDILQKGTKPVKNLTQEDNALLRTTIEMVANSPIKLYAHIGVLILCVLVGLIFFIQFHYSAIIRNQSFGVSSETDTLNPSSSKNNMFTNVVDGLLGVLRSTESNQISITIDSDVYKSVDPKDILSPYVVVVKGLPRDMTNLNDFKSFVETYFNFNVPIDDENSKVLRAVLIYDFVDRLNLSTVLKRVEEDLDHFLHMKTERGSELIQLKEHIVVDEGIVESKNIVSQCFGMQTQAKKIHLFTTEEAIRHLENRRKKLKKEIQKWDVVYNALLQNKSMPKISSIESFEEPNEMEDVQIEENAEEKSTDLNQDPVASMFVGNKAIESSGVGYIIFKTEAEAQEALSRYLNNQIRLQNNLVRISSLQQEPIDINWYTVCRSNAITGSPLEGVGMNVLLHILLIVFFIVASSPASLLSAIQSIFNIGVIKMEVGKIQAATGVVGSIFFQFLPSFSLYWTSRLIGYTLRKLTMLGKYESNQEYTRIFTLRKYCYVVLTILIMPSLWLSSVDGIINYVKTEDDFQQMLKKMFLPASGALMLSTVLQFAVMSNMDDLIRTEDAFWYIWATRLSFYRKAKSPLERLRAATDQYLFKIDSNYAKMLAVFTLCMAYAVFIPVIVPCGLFYMVIKHWFDRYLIQEMYDASVKYSIDVIENKPTPLDYVALQKKSFLLLKIFIASLAIADAFLIIFFSLRIFTESTFLPHFILSGALFVFMIGALFYVQHNQDRVIRTRVLNEITKQNYSSWLRYAKEIAFVTPFERHQ